MLRLCVCLLVATAVISAVSGLLPVSLTVTDVEEILASNSQTNLVVGCIIKYDPRNCDKRLKSISNAALSIFRDQGQCRTCNKNENLIMQKFLKGLQKNHSKAFKKLLRDLQAQNKNTGTDYEYY